MNIISIGIYPNNYSQNFGISIKTKVKADSNMARMLDLRSKLQQFDIYFNKLKEMTINEKDFRQICNKAATLREEWDPCPRCPGNDYYVVYPEEEIVESFRKHLMSEKFATLIANEETEDKFCDKVLRKECRKVNQKRKDCINLEKEILKSNMFSIMITDFRKQANTDLFNLFCKIFYEKDISVDEGYWIGRSKDRLLELLNERVGKSYGDSHTHRKKYYELAIEKFKNGETANDFMSRFNGKGGPDNRYPNRAYEAHQMVIERSYPLGSIGWAAYKAGYIG